MEPLIRYSAPTLYDEYPTGTYCKVIKSLSADYDLYQQVSIDAEHPDWQYVGTYKT